jgi:gliding motility-associated lipoprotein GldD
MCERRPPTTLLFGLLLMLVFAACGEGPVPKPRSYFRIDLPPQEYTLWEAAGPFTAEIPVYARMAAVRQEGRSHWFDLDFPGQRAKVHLTYTRIANDLPELIDDAHAFKGKHQEMAARIGRDRSLRPADRVFGTVFEVDGDAASPMVFYLTDSIDHFLYGALYFHARPNADSLAPVTQRIRADVRHMIGTLQWTGAVKPWAEHR